MVNTRKFSEMVADTLQEGQEAAGLNAGGQNAIMTVNLQFSPSGTTAQRPALPATPTIRYNTDLNAFEFWNGSTWFTIASSSAGGANGEIQFNNLGTLDGDGNFTTNGAGVITIIGQLNVDNLRADGNEISAQNVNGSIVLTPNGSGIVQVPAPTLDLSAATKKYVDDIASGFQFLNPVRMSTTANFASVYDNGSLGVGATLTASSVGAFTADGVAGNLGDRVLVPNQTTTLENGIYVLTTVGDGATQAVLTRATDFDQSSEIHVNELFSVSEGTTRGGQLWRVTSANPVVGTDPITFTLFGVDPNDVMTLSTNQTVTGNKSFTGLLDAESIEFTTTAGIIGTTTNNDADAGSVGEFISSNVPSGSAVGVLNNTAFNITSIVLTPGDWDVWGVVQLLPSPGTTTTQLIGWTSDVSATLATPPNGGSWHQITGISVSAGTAFGLATGTRRFSVASNTTIYLSTFVTFASSTMAAYGYIAARRRR